MFKGFRKASNYVCDCVEDQITNGELCFPESTFADSVFLYSKLVTTEIVHPLNKLHPDHENFKISCYVVKPMVGFYLVELAKRDQEFFDWVSEICALCIWAERALELPLNHFARDVLLGHLKRPSKAARPRKKDWMEKNYIWSLTLELVNDFGLDLTRNDETKAHISACDAMAEGLTVCGRDTGYSEIKNLMVHSDHSRRRKEFEVARRLYFRSNERQGPENALHPDYFDYWAKAASEDVLDIMGTFPTDG